MNKSKCLLQAAGDKKQGRAAVYGAVGTAGWLKSGTDLLFNGGKALRGSCLTLLMTLIVFIPV
jgi:hypothetical protein